MPPGNFGCASILEDEQIRIVCVRSGFVKELLGLQYTPPQSPHLTRIGCKIFALRRSRNAPAYTSLSRETVNDVAELLQLLAESQRQLRPGLVLSPAIQPQLSFCGCDSADPLSATAWGSRPSTLRQFWPRRAGSTHGYDITDHNRFNPEIGTEEEFYQLLTNCSAAAWACCSM